MILHITDDPKEMFRAFPVSDFFLTTANSVVKLSDMSLVMGAGHAAQTLQEFDPDGSKMLSKMFAKGVHELAFDYHGMGTYNIRPNQTPYQDHGGYRMYYAYGVLRSFLWPKGKLGLLQTKYHYKEPSSLDLVAWSLNVLKGHIRQMAKQLEREPRIDMPFPGIGLGKLNEHDVMPYLERFSDSVHVWKLEK